MQAFCLGSGEETTVETWLRIEDYSIHKVPPSSELVHRLLGSARAPQFVGNRNIRSPHVRLPCPIHQAESDCGV